MKIKASVQQSRRHIEYEKNDYNDNEYRNQRKQKNSNLNLLQRFFITITITTSCMLMILYGLLLNYIEMIVCSILTWLVTGVICCSILIHHEIRKTLFFVINTICCDIPCHSMKWFCSLADKINTKKLHENHNDVRNGNRDTEGVVELSSVEVTNSEENEREPNKKDAGFVNNGDGMSGIYSKLVRKTLAFFNYTHKEY